MNQLLTSFLEAINVEKDLLDCLTNLNASLRQSLIARDQLAVATYTSQLNSAAEDIDRSDKARESIWRQVQESFKLTGQTFYAKLQEIPGDHDDLKLSITQGYQALKLSYWQLKNSTTSLEIYTDTAMDITETLLEGVRTHQDDTYSSRGQKEMKETLETRALLIDEEL